MSNNKRNFIWGSGIVSPHILNLGN